MEEFDLARGATSILCSENSRKLVPPDGTVSSWLSPRRSRGGNIVDSYESQNSSLNFENAFIRSFGTFFGITFDIRLLPLEKAVPHSGQLSLQFSPQEPAETACVEERFQ